MSTRDLVHIALFAAIVASLGLIPPLTLGLIPVPITAQSLGVMLAGAILGSRRGGLALLVFVLLVAIGLPVLAGGRGGLGVFFGPSGGFVLAFPIAAFVIGALIERFWDRLGFFTAFASILAGGIGVMYAIGVPWLAAAGGEPRPGDGRLRRVPSRRLHQGGRRRPHLCNDQAGLSGDPPRSCRSRMSLSPPPDAIPAARR